MSISKLKREDLYRVCDPKQFDFTSTADLEERLSALGQDRAISAVELGINIKSKGYNLFCLGPEGTGKTSLVKRILAKEAKTAKRPTIGLMSTILKNHTSRWPLIFLPEKPLNLPKTLTSLLKN